MSLRFRLYFCSVCHIITRKIMRRYLSTLKPFMDGNCDSIQPLSNNSNKETFLHDFLVILKHSLQNYQNILKKCFLGTTSTVLCLNHTLVCCPTPKVQPNLPQLNRGTAAEEVRLNLQEIFPCHS